MKSSDPIESIKLVVRKDGGAMQHKAAAGVIPDQTLRPNEGREGATEGRDLQVGSDVVFVGPRSVFKGTMAGRKRRLLVVMELDWSWMW